jgi:hypothetical protein
MRMANSRAINSEGKGVRYRSQPVSEKARWVFLNFRNDKAAPNIFAT